jgi:hypothetical protein
VVFMGGPLDGQARDVARPDLPFDAVAGVRHPDLGVRFERYRYAPRRLVLHPDVLKPVRDPGWRWVMVPADATDGMCESLLARHCRPMVNGPVSRLRGLLTVTG